MSYICEQIRRISTNREKHDLQFCSLFFSPTESQYSVKRDGVNQRTLFAFNNGSQAFKGLNRTIRERGVA